MSNPQRGGRPDPADPTNYRKLGPIGKAFALKEYPAVVLIDEIDKADIDFPNDLLAVLDDPWMFEIPETGEVIEASEHKPIVIVTSNKEKGNLPAPFLRRCLYYFVNFPEDEEQLKTIVDKHYEILGNTPPPPDLIRAAARRFINVRAEGLLHKKPGTSEFLDWVEALRSFRSGSGQGPQVAEGTPIPYPEVLFKLRGDWQRYVVAQ
jgi:MoxR-like ATPase